MQCPKTVNYQKHSFTMDREFTSADRFRHYLQLCQYHLDAVLTYFIVIS